MNDPALYVRGNDLQRYDIRDFSDEFRDEIGKMSGRCLDVGSGPGDTVVDFILPKLNKNASLVCSDISKEMVNFGKKKYKDNGRVSFIELDIETPDMPNDLAEQFDHVTSAYCLHWCRDMRQAFENIFNLLRPGGTTFLFFVAKNPGMNSYKKLETIPRYQPYIKNVERYIPLFQHSLEPRKTLKALIEDVGFDVHHCSVRERSYTFATPDTFSEFVLGINPLIDFIPVDLMKDFQKDLVNEFARECIVFNKNAYKLLIRCIGIDTPHPRELNCSVMNKPALYVKANDVSHRVASYFIDEFSEEIGEMSGRCLDVGSGPGDLAVDLILPALNKESSLVCSDISEIMLNFAKEKYQDNERLSFLKLDIDSPNLPKDLVEQFDHVTSFWCIQLCQNMRQVFQNILDLLRPGGSTFLLFIARSPGEDCYEELAAMPRYQPYMKDVDRNIMPFQHSSEPRKTLKALIKDVGFEIHHCSVREKDYTFVNPELLSEFLLSIDLYIDRMPANLAEDYKKDLVNEYARLSLMFNKNNEKKDEYSVLIRYQLFIVYLKKPLVDNK